MQGAGEKPATGPNSLSRRDRKKKRFVGQSGQEDKKKIKTESGCYVSSSYKRDLYPEAGPAERGGAGGFLSANEEPGFAGGRGPGAGVCDLP